MRNESKSIKCSGQCGDCGSSIDARDVLCDDCLIGREGLDESKSIVVIGRRWRDRVNGNTYHGAQVIVDGETVHRSGVEYGDFEDTAAAWLESNGYISPRPRYSSGSYSAHMAEHCGTAGIVYTAEAIDVPRKGNLT